MLVIRTTAQNHTAQIQGLLLKLYEEEKINSQEVNLLIYHTGRLPLCSSHGITISVSATYVCQSRSHQVTLLPQYAQQLHQLYHKFITYSTSSSDTVVPEPETVPN